MKHWLKALITDTEDAGIGGFEGVRVVTGCSQENLEKWKLFQGRPDWQFDGEHFTTDIQEVDCAECKKAAS